MYYELLLQEQLIWNIPLLMMLLCLMGIYIFLLIRFTNMKMYHKQPILFMLGIGLLFLVVGSPLSSITQLSFSLHMIQMSILYFIIPPIILLGIPERMYCSLLNTPLMKKVSKLFIAPKIILYSFAILFLIYHLPFVLSILSQADFLQNGYLLLLFILAFGMWWPIVSPDPDERLNHAHMKRYAFRSGLILMPACMLFILTAFMDGGDNPFLSQITAHLCIPQSSSFSLLPPLFNTKIDQIMSGVLMLGLHKIGLIMTFKLGDKVFIYR